VVLWVPLRGAWACGSWASLLVLRGRIIGSLRPPSYTVSDAFFRAIFVIVFVLSITTKSTEFAATWISSPEIS
jgi:hypothetical protein